MIVVSHRSTHWVRFSTRFRGERWAVLVTFIDSELQVGSAVGFHGRQETVLINANDLPKPDPVPILGGEFPTRVWAINYRSQDSQNVPDTCTLERNPCRLSSVVGAP